MPNFGTSESEIPMGIPGEGSWEVFGPMGLGLHLSLDGVGEELMLQDQIKPPKECAVRSGGLGRFIRGHYGP